MTTAQSGAIPEAVLGAHLNFSVQGIASYGTCGQYLFFPSSIIHSVVNNNKAELRQLMRHKRKGLTPAEQAAAAKGLLEQLMCIPVFLGAQSIALYIANDGEIDPVEVQHWCWSNGKKTFVPVVPGDGDRNLLFGELNSNTTFAENRFGIHEPDIPQERLISPRQLDLVLLPLVAFDAKGNRIGMGGGYYDTTFEFLKEENLDQPMLAGLAHEIQRVETVTVEQWDIPLSIVVTNATTYFLSPLIDQMV